MAKIDQVQELSERKHSSEKHYKFMIQMNSMDESIVNYVYDELKFAKNVPLSVFNKNRAISKDPNIYNESNEETNIELKNDWIKWLENRLTTGTKSEKAIAYLTLKQEGQEPLLTDGIKEELERVG